MYWVDLRELTIEGVAFGDTGHPYDRLPARAEGIATEAVWNLNRRPTGLVAYFESDATALHARCMLRKPAPPEFSYTKYLDLYARDERGRWRWVATNTYGFVPSGQTPIFEGLPAATREYALYLPPYYEIERLELGLPEDAVIRPTPPRLQKPILIYGTSVVQGSSASRPGMLWPAILGRKLDWPVVNLGFSGSARMEPELGAIIAEADPCLFIVDPLPNMSLEAVQSNAEPFLRHLLAARPETPILMVEDRIHAHAWLLPDYHPRRDARRAAYRALYEKLLAEGAPMHYLEGDMLLGADSEDTVDGSHPNDLGYMRVATCLQPVVRKLLPKR